MIIEGMEIEEFIVPEEIENILAEAKNTKDDQIDAILSKAEKFGGLSHVEVASLLMMDEKHLPRLFQIARTIKETSY